MSAAFTVRALTRAERREVYRRRMVEDFPANELKPLAMIEAAIARGEYRFLGALDAGGGALAYAGLVCLSREGRAICLFDYLAVRRDARGQGLGGAFLRALSGDALAGFDCVLLESDDPAFAPDAAEREVRERRLRFYEHSGLVDTGATACVFGADFRLLAFPRALPRDLADTRRVYAEIYRSLLSPGRFARNVRIPGET